MRGVRLLKLIDEDGGLSTLYKQRVAMAALEVMAESFNVPLGRLTMASRQRANVAFARQMAMYLSHVVGQLSQREVAIEFDREASTVSHACHTIEDRRNGDVFDHKVAALEDMLRVRLKAVIDQTIADESGALAPPLEIKRLLRAG